LVHDKELAAEDEQVFLMKQQSLLAKQPATPTRASDKRLCCQMFRKNWIE
ncbi:DYNC1LI2 isoform 14, partial [Pan troglodytes]